MAGTVLAKVQPAVDEGSAGVNVLLVNCRLGQLLTRLLQHARVKRMQPEPRRPTRACGCTCYGSAYRCCFEACARSSLLLWLADFMEARELRGPPPSFFCLCLSRALGPARRPDLCAWIEGEHVTQVVMSGTCQLKSME